MKIPKNTVSASQMRTYGSNGITLEEHESEKGCPRKYKAKYVDGLQEPPGNSYALLYGTFFHEILFHVEEGLTPDEALEKAFHVSLPQEMWTEARNDLENYFSRENSPSDRFGTLATEQELSAVLYEDEDFGTIYYRGFLDLIALDLNVKDVIHFVDYKTNRSPASFEDLLGDVQMRGYHWLIQKNWSKWLSRKPKIISHLDVIKFRDVEITYTDADIEDWHSWAVAVTRKILRDETAEPILNESCGHCFVRDTCPAYNALPTLAETLEVEGHALKDPVKRLEWRDRADKIKKLLDKGVKSIDEEFKAEALLKEQLIVGNQMFVKEPTYSNIVDIRRLHELLGDEDFYRVVSTSKAAIDKYLKGADADKKNRVTGTISRAVTGSKVSRRKAGGLK